MFTVAPSVNRSAVEVNPKAVVNRTQIFHCPVSGIPAPRVVWMKNGKPIDLRGDIELRDGGRQLVIRSVSLDNAATYRCVATNRAGQDSIDFVFDVQGT